jgi:REP element-mobilizing transposase RayT
MGLQNARSAWSYTIMSPPPIIAYHIVFGAYGFWLPNDPRGSWSKYVFADRLKRFGPPQLIRREVTAEAEVLRQQMKAELKYPPVRFDGIQARAIGRGFRDILHKLRMPAYAAAIMPDHVHIVVGRRDMYAEDIARHLKRAASRKMRKEGVLPMLEFQDEEGATPTSWERGGWKVFLHTPEEIELAMQYVNDNPIVAGLPTQHWNFIQQFES